MFDGDYINALFETLNLANKPALGIAVKSPQRRHGARTCNVKPDDDLRRRNAQLQNIF